MSKETTEAEKAAAEAYPDTNWGLAGVVRERVAYARGWNAHASRLSPPTREVLAAELKAWMLAKGIDPLLTAESLASITPLVWLALIESSRFSLSAPEEDWEYGVNRPNRSNPSDPPFGPMDEGSADGWIAGEPTATKWKRHRAGPWLPVPAPSVIQSPVTDVSDPAPAPETGEAE